MILLQNLRHLDSHAEEEAPAPRRANHMPLPNLNKNNLRSFSLNINGDLWLPWPTKYIRIRRDVRMSIYESKRRRVPLWFPFSHGRGRHRFHHAPLFLEIPIRRGAFFPSLLFFPFSQPFSTLTDSISLAFIDPERIETFVSCFGTLGRLHLGEMVRKTKVACAVKGNGSL